MKSRNYCFTINNYTKEDIKRLHELGESQDKHRYLCFGLELAPETGTKHIQGYIQLNTAQRFSFLQKYFNLRRGKEVLKFHLEIANGTPEENRDYCKKDGDFYEFGEPLKQGERTDLLKIKNLVKENPNDLKVIIDEHGNNFQQVRYTECLQKYYLNERDPSYAPKVYWVFGPSGVGKTRLVYETFTDICSVSSYKWLGTGYKQNECFLLDDFRQGNLEFEEILKITDRYPYTLFFKGGQIPLYSPYIVFTSPFCIDQTFTFTSEDLKQIKRRVVEIDLGNISNKKDIDLKNLDAKFIFGNSDNCNPNW